MKSLLLTPTFFPKLTGNAVTVDRISRQLAEGGIICKTIDVSALSEKALVARALDFAPDIIHAFHAWKAGRIGLTLKERLGIPMITTVTGTDVNVDLHDRRKRDDVLRVFARSDAVTVFNEEARSLLVESGVAPSKINVIHQSVFFPRQKKTDYRKLLKIGKSTPVFLLLGSIRKIKNPRTAIEALKKARQKVPDLRLLIAGSVLEPNEFRNVGQWIEREEWITYLGEIPRHGIRSLLQSADFLVNTSSSESEANAVMEAMSCGAVVIGKNISGNASLLTDETSLLFHDRRELYEQILYGLGHRKERKEIAGRAKQAVSAEPFRFTTEKERYLNIYRTIGRR